MKRSLPICAFAALAALAAGGCGGNDDEPERRSGPKPPPGWCETEDGRDFFALTEPIQQAYADGDAGELKALTDQALELAEDAPEGDPCATLQLGQLSQFWQTGQVKAAEGVQPRAESGRVREFARREGLDRPGAVSE